MTNKHHGSSLDDFLKEEGILAAVEATARCLHDAGVVNTATLRGFERQALLLSPAPKERTRPSSASIHIAPTHKQLQGATN